MCGGGGCFSSDLTIGKGIAMIGVAVASHYVVTSVVVGPDFAGLKKHSTRSPNKIHIAF